MSIINLRCALKRSFSSIQQGCTLLIVAGELKWLHEAVLTYESKKNHIVVSSSKLSAEPEIEKFG